MRVLAALFGCLLLLVLLFSPGLNLTPLGAGAAILALALYQRRMPAPTEVLIAAAIGSALLALYTHHEYPVGFALGVALACAGMNALAFGMLALGIRSLP